MIIDTDLQQISDKLDDGLGRFSPGQDAYMLLSYARDAVRAAEREVREHDRRCNLVRTPLSVVQT